jgi:hypothetical protein
MNIARRLGLSTVAFIVAAVASERRVVACDCVILPTREYLRAADVVYTGRVVDIRADSRRFASPEVEFRVERAFKGRVEGKRMVLVTPIGKGVDCSGFDFVVGETYVVFASARGSAAGVARTYGVNWCGGTASLATATGKQRLGELEAHKN